MNKIKTIIAFIASMALVATAAIAGTLAHLTSADSDVNTLTSGQVHIKQIEQQRKDYTENQQVLVDFVQRKELLPAVYSGDSIPWAPEDEWVVPGDQAWKVVEDNVNVIDKFVTVKNTGDKPAYVRTIIAYEGDPIKGTDIHIVHNSDNVNPEIKTKYIENVMIDGVRYDIIEYTYPEPLNPNDTTVPSLKQVYMDKTCDNSDVIEYGETYDILVFSQAVQVKGYADAETALNEAFGETTSANHPWVKTEAPMMEDAVLDIEDNYVLFNQPLIREWKAITPYTINGNGNTIFVNITDEAQSGWEEGLYPIMGNVFSSSNNSEVTVNELTISGTMQTNMVGHPVKGDYTARFDKVNIINPEMVGQTDGRLGRNNVTGVSLSPITPALWIAGKMDMTNCNIYGATRSSVDTECTAPVYDLAIVNGADVKINGGKIGSMYLWNQAKVALYDVQVDSIDTAAISTRNYGSLIIGKGTTVDEIKVVQTHNSLPPILTVESGAIVETLDLSDVKLKNSIKIEEGATVNNIVANGVTYTSIDEWKNA